MRVGLIVSALGRRAVVRAFISITFFMLVVVLVITLVVSAIALSIVALIVGSRTQPIAQFVRLLRRENLC